MKRVIGIVLLVFFYILFFIALPILSKMPLIEFFLLNGSALLGAGLAVLFGWLLN